MYNLVTWFDWFMVLRGLGSQKIDFFYIAFFNSITIQKVNDNVLNRLDEKWKNETKRLSAFRKNWRAAGNRSLFYLCFVFQWLQKKRRFRSVWNFFCFHRTFSFTGWNFVLSCKNFWFWEKFKKIQFPLLE